MAPVAPDEAGVISARAISRDLAARLRRHAEAIATRRARQINEQQTPAEWRSADALWPDFGRD